MNSLDAHISMSYLVKSWNISIVFILFSGSFAHSVAYYSQKKVHTIQTWLSFALFELIRFHLDQTDLFSWKLVWDTFSQKILKKS